MNNFEIPFEKRVFEKKSFLIKESFSSLKMCAMNNELIVNQSSNEFAEIEIIFMKKASCADLSVRVVDGCLVSMYDCEQFSDVKIVLNIPAKVYEDIVLKSCNGLINVNDISAKNININSVNAAIMFRGVVSNIDTRTENGKVDLVFEEFSSSSANCNVETTNGSIYIKLANDELLIDGEINNSSPYSGFSSRDIYDLPILSQIIDTNEIKHVRLGVESALQNLNLKIKTTNGSVVIR